MSGRFRPHVPRPRLAGRPLFTVGRLFTAFMVLLFLAIGLGPVMLTRYGHLTVAGAIETTVMLVGAAYLFGMLVVFRYF